MQYRSALFTYHLSFFTSHRFPLRLGGGQRLLRFTLHRLSQGRRVYLNRLPALVLRRRHLLQLQREMQRPTRRGPPLGNQSPFTSPLSPPLPSIHACY
jgi:hypothetical protein